MGLELKELRLIPGVDYEMTPALAQAVIISSQNIRWKEGLFEKLGGWSRYYPNSVGDIPRFLWGWQDLDLGLILAVGAASFLKVIENGVVTDITPQTDTTNSAPNFSTVMGSTTVSVVDSNITDPTINNVVYIATPVAIGGIVLYGLYSISAILSSDSYQIQAALPATSTVNNGGALMTFTTVANSALVSIDLDNHGLQVGSEFAVQVPITLGGLTIGGVYLVSPAASVTSSAFSIVASMPATSSAGPTSQNGGNVEFVYYIALGPQQPFSPYGFGNYGAGGWGTGTALPSGAGTPIATTDWTGFNWGDILIACPTGQPIFTWDPQGSTTIGQMIAGGPIAADGIFLATPQQILVAWGVTTGQNTQTGSAGTIANIGVFNPLRLVWSDAGDYTDFTAQANNFAGGFNLSSGSKIVSCVQGANQFVVFTDIGVWSGTFVGQPLVFSIVEVMKGCGLVSRHGAGVLGTSFYWMSQNQFFTMSAGGVPIPMPCSVWDNVFQNINRNFITKVQFYANAAFNEIGWFYPSAASTGECDTLVKYDVVQNLWDVTGMGRSAWMDQSVLGPPIGGSNGLTDPISIIYQHETSPDADGAPLGWSLTTGDFVLGTGDEFMFVDYFIPDFRYGYLNGFPNASVQITFFMKGFPGTNATDPILQSPTFTVTSQSPFIEPRIRGRQFSIVITGSDLGTFVRGGLCRYRAAPDGRNP